MNDQRRNVGARPDPAPNSDLDPELGAEESATPGARRKLSVRKPDAETEGEKAGGAARRGLRTRFKAEGLKPGKRPVERKPRRQAAQADQEPRRDSDASRRSSRSPSSAPRMAPRQQAPGAQAPKPEVTRESLVEGVRLSKIMAERGLCSRREADAIIERGWVFVDGRRVSELGIRIDPGAVIELAPEAEARQARQVTILLHKPVGYVSGQPEPGYEPAVVLIGAESQFDAGTAERFHHSHLRGLAPAGRLDIDSTGLLVLTQNGRIARQLIGEDSKIEKEYLVRVEGELDAQGLALLKHGLELDGRALRPAKVEWINDDQLRFVLREGRKRQIRRMCELVGLKVVGLKRVRIGGVKLSELPLGQWRFLRTDERF